MMLRNRNLTVECSIKYELAFAWLWHKVLFTLMVDYFAIGLITTLLCSCYVFRYSNNYV